MIMRKMMMMAAVGVWCSMAAQSEYTVIVNPAAEASTGVRIGWHTDPGRGSNACYVTRRDDAQWRAVRRVDADTAIITAFDSLMSKQADGTDCIERVRFTRHVAEVGGLLPATEYMYRFADNDTARVGYFRTAPADGAWTAAVISDFHSYSPLPKRAEAAMAMLDTLEHVNGGDFDMVLHVGDVCAWGGSYSFWRNLYSKPQFAKYLWAGVNGNHDNMDRKSTRLSGDYFHYANANPLNGYAGQEGVCYHFTYGQVLFIMLNSEAMRSAEGLEAAQQWVRRVIAENPAKYVVVMEHYQWFFGTNGRTSQYERWHTLFDECGVDLAIAGNNHIYARTNALYDDAETDGTIGCVYVQTPSSDNERGQATDEWTDNRDKIKYIWSEGPKTVGALLMHVSDDRIILTLYDRKGHPLDTATVLAKR